MKKAVYILLALLMVFSLTGCRTSGADANDNTTDGVIGNGITDDFITDDDNNTNGTIDNNNGITNGTDNGTNNGTNNDTNNGNVTNDNNGNVTENGNGNGLITDENGQIDIGNNTNDLDTNNNNAGTGGRTIR